MPRKQSGTEIGTAANGSQERLFRGFVPIVPINTHYTAYIKKKSRNRHTHDVYARIGKHRHNGTKAQGGKVMRESSIERKLVTEAKKRGGLAVKFVSPGLDGVPDRLVLLPGEPSFRELKPASHSSARRMAQLTALGFGSIIDGKELIGVLDEIQSADKGATRRTSSDAPNPAV